MKKFFDLRTIEWKNGKVHLIDQTKLPDKLVYVTFTKPTQVANAIKNMVVRGAPAIGVTAAMGLALTAYNSKSKSKSGFIKELKNTAKTLESTRPTAVNLFWATSRILDVVKSSEGEVYSMINRVIEEAKKMANEDVESNMKIGENGAKLLKDGDVVLTHCKWPKRSAECWSVGYGRLWNSISTY